MTDFVAKVKAEMIARTPGVEKYTDILDSLIEEDGKEFQSQDETALIKLLVAVRLGASIRKEVFYKKKESEEVYWSHAYDGVIGIIDTLIFTLISNLMNNSSDRDLETT